MNIILLALIMYLLFRFVSGFLIPVLRTSRQVHRQFQDMAGHRNNPAGDPAGNGHQQNHNDTEHHSSTTKGGEYIDFEEIK